MQAEKKRALGRGLSALIPQAATNEPERDGGALTLPVGSITRDETQPRKIFDEAKLRELADSIRTQGVIQPVIVRSDGSGGYRLIAGERRWRAAQLAGLSEIPAVVRDVSDAEAFELALVENLQRADLNPIEEADGYRRLIDERGLTQEQVAERVGKERSTVANALRLLQLPEEVRAMVANNEIDMGHARALLGLNRPPELVALARVVAQEKLSVRETERRVRFARGEAASARSRRELKQSPQARQLSEELQRLLGTKVRIMDRGGNGTIEVEFFSYEDLDRLLGHFRK